MARDRKARSEGVRRLSLAVGGACVLLLPIIFFVDALNGVNDFKDVTPEQLAVMVLVLAGCFLFGWCAVRLIAWVWRGFSEDESEAKRGSN
jgi:hypothetical protein